MPKLNELPAREEQLRISYESGEEDGLAAGTGGVALSTRNTNYVHGRLLAAVVRLEERVEALEHNQLGALQAAE